MVHPQSVTKISPTYSVASSELVEVTGILATILAHGMGNCGVSAPTIRKDATDLIIKWLLQTGLPIDLRQSIIDDGGKRTPARGAWKEFVNDRVQETANDDDYLRERGLQAVLLPIDGATSLGDGRAGTMVWAALSDATSLNPFRKLMKNTGEQGYSTCADTYCFVLTSGSNADPTLRREIANLVGKRAVLRDSSIPELLRSDQLCGVFKNKKVLVAHTMETPEFRHGHATLGHPTLGRRLDGSAVVSALAALTQRTDVGLCVCRLPALPVIAAAAKVTGGLFVALPLTGTSRKLKVPSEIKYLGMHDVLTADPRITIAGSSVTEICVSDRVRWNACPWRPLMETDHGTVKPLFMSFHSVVMDTQYALFEERTTHLDMARVRFAEVPVSRWIDTYRGTWDRAYAREIAERRGLRRRNSRSANVSGSKGDK